MDDHNYSAQVLNHSVSPEPFAMESDVELHSVPDASPLGQVVINSAATAAIAGFVNSSNCTPVEQIFLNTSSNCTPVEQIFVNTSSNCTPVEQLVVNTSSNCIPVEQNEALTVVETVEVVSSTQEPCFVESDLEKPESHQDFTSESNFVDKEKDEEEKTESEGQWDGVSCVAEKGLVFRSREEINRFMTLYKESNCCQYCVYSGGITEKCTSKRVRLITKL